jgi:hypothetical protein
MYLLEMLGWACTWDPEKVSVVDELLVVLEIVQC